MSDAAEPQHSASFRFRHFVDVRFRDLDPMGHAHHTLPLIYLEEARAEYWRAVVGRESLDEIDYVMAEITLRLHRRIHWPERLEVLLRTARLGGKSFDMEFEIRNDTGHAVASGRTVQVMYDYDAAASAPIPEDMRKRIEAFEPGLGTHAHATHGQAQEARAGEVRGDGSGSE